MSVCRIGDFRNVAPLLSILIDHPDRWRDKVSRSIVELKGLESVASNDNFSATSGRSRLRFQVLQEHVLDVSEGIFNVPEVKRVVRCKVLPVSGGEDSHRAGRTDAWRIRDESSLF